MAKSHSCDIFWTLALYLVLETLVNMQRNGVLIQFIHHMSVWFFFIELTMPGGEEKHLSVVANATADVIRY
ncbi:unnamed protein product [Cochlearia groenlandica]